MCAFWVADRVGLVSDYSAFNGLGDVRFCFALCDYV